MKPEGSPPERPAKRTILEEIASHKRGEVERLLRADIPAELGVSRSVALLRDGYELVTAHEGNLRLPVHHAAVRRVASSGGAMPVAGRLRQLVEQGRELRNRRGVSRQR